MRRWIDLTNEAQHGGTREISLERAEKKKSVDRADPFHNYIHIRAKTFYVHNNSRNVAAKLLKYTRSVLELSERVIPQTGYHCTIMAAGVRAIFGPCRQVAGLVPRLRDGMGASSRPLAARDSCWGGVRMHMEWKWESRTESRMSCLYLRYLWCAYSSTCAYIGSSVVIAGKVPVMHIA